MKRPILMLASLILLLSFASCTRNECCQEIPSSHFGPTPGGDGASEEF